MSKAFEKHNERKNMFKEEYVLTVKKHEENKEKIREMDVPMAYFDDHVFDENKTVLWNREKVIEKNKEREEIIKEKQKLMDKENIRFEKEIMKKIKKYTGLKMKLANVVLQNRNVLDDTLLLMELNYYEKQ